MMKNRSFHIIVLVALLVGLLSSAAPAKEYVSLPGQFYLTYPDSWYQVDYETVDRKLVESNAGQVMLDYDAVLGPEGVVPFYSGPYVIITIDTSGEYSQTRIDSVLNELTTMFSEDARYFPLDEHTTDLKANSPNYHEDEKLISVLNTLTTQGDTIKRNLILFKFYDRGLVTMYCYAPDSLFEGELETFISMARSISTDDVAAHLPKENLKVADIEHREEFGGESGRSSWMNFIIWMVAALIVVFILARMIRRMKR